MQLRQVHGAGGTARLWKWPGQCGSTACQIAILFAGATIDDADRGALAVMFLFSLTGSIPTGLLLMTLLCIWLLVMDASQSDDLQQFVKQLHRGFAPSSMTQRSLGTASVGIAGCQAELADASTLWFWSGFAAGEAHLDAGSRR